MGFAEFLFCNVAITVGVHSLEDLIRVRTPATWARLSTRGVGCRQQSGEESGPQQ
ncbi:MAG: hypothetical protein ACF8TS_06435 [Maioricimonas sp. JB049]